MIYCNLKGGLGNMLFQIAATKAMSVIKNTDYSFPNFTKNLDIIRNEKSREYALEYKNFLKLQEIPLSSTSLKTYEYPFHYIELAPDENNFILDGYFQSEKYFYNIKKDIIKLFEPTEEIEKILNLKYSNIINSNSVSVHVRRGDYVSLQNYHNVLDIKYYLECLSIFKESELIVVFSDDIKWCKENFKFKNIFFIENEKDYIELYLMSKCKHNIIGNSSFSWWAAWLNKNNNKKIIAPKNWFGPSLNYLITDDIYCQDWIKI